MDAKDSRVALGRSCHADAFTAARQAAEQARQQFPADALPAWALALAGGRHAPQALLNGFRTLLGDIPVVGGCGAGIITAAAATLTGYECGLLLFPATLKPAGIAVVDGLDQDEAAVGRRLGTVLREMVLPETTVLLFYDSVHHSPPPILHAGSRLLDGLYEGLGELQATVIGAGTLTDMSLLSSYIFDGRRVRRHAAVAVALPTGLNSHIAIMHGCYPASDFLEITRVDNNRILELNGRPALTVVVERLGIPADRLSVLPALQFSLILGEKYGDPFAPFDDRQYVNRLVIGTDAKDGALILFDADFHAGTRVQLMVTDASHMLESARHQTGNLLDTLAGQTPIFGLYIDCAGRSAIFNGTEEDESTPIRERIGPLCPLLGFYSGVEIAPLLGRSRTLDWTGILALFTGSVVEI